MKSWVSAVDSKATLILEQLSVARAIASENGGDLEKVSKQYFDLLHSLYRDEYAFAQLADSSDLVARFAGPAVSHGEPTVTIVTSVFSNLRNQIRNIAKSVVGLSDSERIRWPSELDLVLTGVTHGSLVVGINISRPEAADDGQLQFPGISDQMFESVRSAVRSLTVVARYVKDDIVDEAIAQEIPDPAIRDTVMVAVSRIAPTGRKGINQVSLYGQDEADTKPPVLTPVSRKVLRQSLSHPLVTKGEGNFRGVVREIDLDARRFELRRVQGGGTVHLRGSI